MSNGEKFDKNVAFLVIFAILCIASSLDRNAAKQNEGYGISLRRNQTCQLEVPVAPNTTNGRACETFNVSKKGNEDCVVTGHGTGHACFTLDELLQRKDSDAEHSHGKKNQDYCCMIKNLKPNDTICGEGGSLQCYDPKLEPRCMCPFGRTGQFCGDEHYEKVKCDISRDYNIPSGHFISCYSKNKSLDSTHCQIDERGWSGICKKIEGKTEIVPECSFEEPSSLLKSSEAVSLQNCGLWQMHLSLAVQYTIRILFSYV